MHGFSDSLAWIAQGGASSSQTPPNFGIVWVILALVAFMYLIVFRPQKRERDERQKRLDSIKKGDRIVTIGGIHGKVVEAPEKQSVLTIEIAPKVTIRINRSAVSTIDAKGSAKAEGKSETKAEGKTEEE